MLGTVLNVVPFLFEDTANKMLGGYKFSVNGIIDTIGYSNSLSAIIYVCYKSCIRIMKS